MTQTLFLASAIVLMAAILQTGIGFGFAIIATPLLSLIYPPQIAIHINITLSLMISVLMLPVLARSVDWGMMARMALGSAIGAPVGLLFYIFADPGVMRISIGVFILCVTALIAFQFVIRQNRRNEYLAGVLSGAFTSSIGMPGPPLLIYFAASKTDKVTLRATTLTFFLFVFAISLGLQLYAEPVNGSVWIDNALLIPITLIGMVLGQIMFRYLAQETVRAAALALLAITGIALLTSAVASAG